MVEFLVATDSVDTSEILLEYLEPRIGADDRVVALNSLHGGEQTTEADVRSGEQSLQAIVEGLPCEVETRQLVRGNEPATDVLSLADEAGIDEIVIGIRDRNPTGKVVFGSTSQDVLLNSDRPVVCVPKE